MKNILKTDWGVIPYREAWKRQQEYFAKLLESKAKGESAIDYWITCQHQPVITLGKHADPSNLLFSENTLAQRGVEVVQIDRGGDVTFHGLGQLVVYPILDLENYGLGLRSYIHLLEECVIRTIAEYGLKGERIDGASGVWIDKDTPYERKICAIGVKSSRFVTMHGLAFNVNTDLSYFSLIHPCGFVDKGVTSLSKETGCLHNMNEVAERLAKHATVLLECNFFS